MIRSWITWVHGYKHTGPYSHKHCLIALQVVTNTPLWSFSRIFYLSAPCNRKVKSRNVEFILQTDLTGWCWRIIQSCRNIDFLSYCLWWLSWQTGPFPVVCNILVLWMFCEPDWKFRWAECGPRPSSSKLTEASEVIYFMLLLWCSSCSTGALKQSRVPSTLYI